MRIIVDSREQKPFAFEGPFYTGVEIESGALSSGDYSLPGLTDKIAVERKELPDLIACFGRERERFERELVRARGFDFFAVVVEGSYEDIARGRYKSKFNPKAAIQTIAAFSVRYGVSFCLAGTRAGAEYMTFSYLRQYLESARKRLKTIVGTQGN